MTGMRERITHRALSLAGDRRVAVAVSGGADSAVAAWALRDVTREAIHIHHGYPASGQLMVGAQAVAAFLGIDLTVVRVTTTGPSETAARLARWAALFETAGPDRVVATGHTLDDQAETVLLNLLRGSGPEGLAGMRQRDRVIRPLLAEGRMDVRSLARELGLPYVDDPANLSMEHRRNRVRTEVIPRLEEFNPDLRESLARTASHLALVGPAPAPFDSSGGVARISLAMLRTTPAATAVATVREAVRSIRPPHPPTSAEVDRVMAVATGDVLRAELAEGVVVLRDRTSLRLGPVPGPIEAVPLESPVTWAGGFRLGVGRSTGFPLLSPERTRLRADLGWQVRGAERSDRIALPDGHKSAWDALGEVGVPAELRSAWPVVTDGENVEWIPLVRRAAGPRPSDVGYLEVDTSEELW